LVYFSALKDVQELGVDDLDLDIFTAQAQLYLGHITQTLGFLALAIPLDDFKPVNNCTWEQKKTDLALVPQPAPLLRGWLMST